MRNERVATLYEKLYEDNAEGKVTDEWFMQLSHKYEVERMELKSKIVEYSSAGHQLARPPRPERLTIAWFSAWTVELGLLAGLKIKKSLRRDAAG